MCGLVTFMANSDASILGFIGLILLFLLGVALFMIIG